jgi:hypothetical protein
MVELSLELGMILDKSIVHTVYVTVRAALLLLMLS